MAGVSSEGFYHSIAASQRRRDLPGEQEQRKVPGRDYTDDPQRLAYRVIQGICAVGRFCLKRFQPRHFHQVSKDAEIRRSARNIEPGGQRDRLAGVGYLSLDKTVKPLFNCVRNPVQSGGTLANSEASPFSAQCLPRRMHGLVHLCLVGFGDLRDHCSVGGIHVRKLTFPGHEAAIDVVLD